MTACPHGHAKLVVSDSEGHTGLVCPTCHGTWLPFRYIDAIRYVRHFSAEDFGSGLSQATKGRTTLPCPEGCGALNVAEASGIELDWCETCRGVWFDNGELKKLLAAQPLRNNDRNSGPYVVAQTGLCILQIILLGLLS